MKELDAGKKDVPVCGTAVLLAENPVSSLGAITARKPAYLLPMAGRSLADRTLGLLSDVGVDRLIVMSSDAALADFLGDGARWGLEIKVIDLRDLDQVVARLKGLRLDEPFLLGKLSYLPNLNKTLLGKWVEEKNAVLESERRPVGWAVLQPEVLESLSTESADSLFEQLCAYKTEPSPEPHLSCQSARALLESAKVLFSKELELQQVNGASVDTGIWIGAGSVIHPTAQLVPPVWIGENCRLGRAVRLGPCVALESDSIIGDCSTLENVMVLPSTVVGEQLELKDVVVDRNYLAYADSAHPVAIPDTFLIAPNHTLHPVDWMRRQVGRLIALLWLVPLLPVFLVLYLIGRIAGVKVPVERVSMVRLPADASPDLWKNVVVRRWVRTGSAWWNKLVDRKGSAFLLACWDIAFGCMHWVGLRPRSSEEVQALPEDWRMLYLSCVAGFFELAEVDRKEIGDFSPEQQYSSEAFYVASRCFRVDVSIILRTLFAHRRISRSDSAPAILSLLTGDGLFEQLHRFLREQWAEIVEPSSRAFMHEIITAVHEAVANIFQHAYDGVSGQPIQLHFLAADDRVCVELYDLGHRFDPVTVPSPDFETEGGYGWYMINQVAESVVYSHADTGWNRLVLSFNLKGEMHHGVENGSN